MEKPWRIQYFGSLALWDTNGKRIDAVPVKAQAVVAILHLSRPYGLPREELGQILWPDSEPARQLASLRGALFALRRHISESHLMISRSQCLLSDDMRIQSDFDSPRNSSFMPGFEGAWFDQMRYDVATSTVSEMGLPSEVTVYQSYLKLLTWYAHQNPVQMLDVLRSSIDLSLDMPPQHIKDLLAVASPSLEPLSGHLPWLKFWQGWLLEQETIGRGEDLLQTALNQALDQGDFVLATESINHLLAAYSLQCRTDNAKPLAALSGNLLRKTSGIPVLCVAQANYESHLGNHQRAVAHLEECLSGMDSEDFRRIRIEALLGFYEACHGDYDQAEYYNTKSKAAMRSVGNFRVQMITTLTDAHVALGTGRYSEAVTGFEEVLDQASTANGRQLAIYGQEGLAACHRLIGDEGRARDALEKGRAMRQRAKMPYTRWDRQRLGPVLTG